MNVELKNYPVVDENGLFIDVRFPLNKDSDGNYLLSGGCVPLDVPIVPDGFVAVLSENKDGWIFKENNSGEYYDVNENKSVIIDYPLTEIPDNLIKGKIDEYELYNKNTKQIEFNLIKYKEDKINELSIKCNTERKKILPDVKILNVFAGATLGYPNYLTVDNVRKLIEIYKDIYHTYSMKINIAESPEQIDDIINEIVFPTAEYFIKTLTG